MDIYNPNHSPVTPYNQNKAFSSIHPQTRLNKPELRGSWTPFTWVEKYRYLFSGPFNKPEIALTFDDGPDEVYTPQILDRLNTFNVKATFFLLGQNIQEHPDMVRRIVNEGHIVANHSYDHPNFSTVSLTEFQNQIITTGNLIADLVGYHPTFIRPPYGVITEEQLQWATEQKYIVVQWNIDTNDWRGLSGEEITGTVIANAFPGSIVLQHNAFSPLQGTVESLGQFIPQLQSDGAEFVTLAQMLASYV